MDDFHTQNPFGSTRLASEAEATVLSEGCGPVAIKGRTVMRSPYQEPTIIYGGAGCGKGAQLGLCQPVHESTQSAFFLDVGAQYMSVTWHWQLAMGREAYAINPYGIGAYPDINHPVHLWGILKDDAYLFDNAKRIAAMAILEAENEGENAWVGSGARRWLTRLLILLVLVTGRATPAELWQLVNEINSDDQAIKDWARLAEALPYQVYDTLVEIYTKKKDSPKEYGAIVGKILDDLDWLSSPHLAASVSGEIDYLSHLPHSDKKTCIYYVIPSGSGKHNQSLTRMVVGVGQLHCIQENSGSRPLFYLEEAATCGKAEFIKSAVSEFRKYFRTILVYQSHGQLTHLFGKSGAQEIMDSCGMQLYLGGGIRDINSATRLADSVGKTTINIDDAMSQGAHAFQAETARLDALFEGGDPLRAEHINRYEEQLSSTQRQAGRHILDPAELLKLKDEVLVLSPGSGVPPVLAKKLPPYWQNPAMAGRYGPDPLFPPLDRVSVRHRLWGQVRRQFIHKSVPTHLSHLPNHINGKIAYVKGYKTW